MGDVDSFTTATGSVRLEGWSTLVRTLRKAGVDLGELKEANAAAGRIIAARAAEIAPRRTGRLASSIRTQGGVHRVRVAAGKASAPYAGPIHWGWPARHIKAQPFLSDAARQTEPEWFPAFVRDVTKILEKIEGT
jgi:HK97 gp10 family phage protein